MTSYSNTSSEAEEGARFIEPKIISSASHSKMYRLGTVLLGQVSTADHSLAEVESEINKVRKRKTVGAAFQNAHLTAVGIGAILVRLIKSV